MVPETQAHNLANDTARALAPEAARSLARLLPRLEARYVPSKRGQTGGWGDFTRRLHAGDRVLILASFSENPQTIPANEFRLQGLTGTFTDLLSGAQLQPGEELGLGPFQFVWLCMG